ncbi:hypothetical protein GGR56DRAFT_324337 [Xylariaceae sp. FL0804]|nr:hypothetical protein GGR56DRAFT_324337 [Xylariaceae sp. FL0804]
MVTTVVVLGGAYAGLQIAHRLLKHTRPTIKDLKVILVSKNSHFFWNLASVRAIVPGVLKEEDYTREIAPGFAKYPAEAFEFIIGTAEAVEPEARTVRVACEGGSGGGEQRTLNYDQLVLATGTRCVDSTVPWKNNGTYEEISSMMADTVARVRAARHIVVAGAGATGVETAGELAYEYGSGRAGGGDEKNRKEILLLSADDTVMGGDSLASTAEAELRKLGVTIRNRARVASDRQLENGKTEVVLESGDRIETDLYMPTMGMIPNTEYLPPSMLNERKFVAVDNRYQVRDTTNVWAAGDIVSKPRGSFVLTGFQAAGVAKNIDAVLRHKKPGKVSTIPFDTLMVATGRERGCGRLGSLNVFPSIMVHKVKGKTLGIEQLPGYVDGSRF